jgi:hypothetical protein
VCAVTAIQKLNHCDDCAAKERKECDVNSTTLQDFWEQEVGQARGHTQMGGKKTADDMSHL